MKYICFFDEPAALDLALVGGKGTNLAKMTAAGFPVPPGFCVTAGAYRHLTAITGLGNIIARRMERIDFADPIGIASAAAQIRELISQQPIPETIALDVITAYEKLASHMGSESTPPVAVRSSATAEDLPEASFAGQQDTYLNISGQDALLEHVRLCWASLWTARAITYRHQQAFDHEQVMLAVVVQAMVKPQSAGITFTANPVSGREDECVINASWGLGEAIVSGIVSPDTYIVNKTNGRIREEHIATKKRMIISGPDGGAVEIDTAPHLRNVAVLNDRRLAELTALASRIEHHYGQPQDIEWAHDGKKWHILQSRPITTLQKKMPTTGIKGHYSRAMFVEIFPEAISPVFLSVVSPLLATMLDFTFQQLGLPLPDKMEAVRDFYNQPYFNAGAIETAFAPLPSADRRRLSNQFINPISHHEPGGHVSITQLKLLVRLLRFWRRFKQQLPDLLAQFRVDVAALDSVPLKTTADDEIIRRIKRMVFEGASRLLNGDFLLIALAGTFNNMILRILSRYYEAEAPEILNALLTGVTGNVIMETNELLWRLAQEANTALGVRAALLRGEPSVILDELQETANGRRFLKELHALLAVCGHRELHLDILYPTWGEDPSPVLNYIRGYLDADPRQNPAARQAQLVLERHALTAEVLARIRQDLPGRLCFAPLFSWLLKQIHELLRERDTMHYEWTRLFPPCRRLLLELGRRWTDRELLQTPEDIFYLRLQELEAIARHPEPQMKLVQDRRVELAANLHGPWPEVIQDGREIFRESAKHEQGLLRGIAGSPGRVTGPCRIIQGPHDFGRLEHGDILVAPLTNPVWTPLFAIAGGLVTNVGGILSHGAIVAREYGIPAVMSVSGATEQLADGQIITVDGTKGMITLLPTNRNAFKVENQLLDRVVQ